MQFRKHYLLASSTKLAACLIASVGLIGTSAFAADMAVKGPPAAPAPAYSWTGWYAGVNAGASMGKVKTDFNGAPLFGVVIPDSQFTPGFGLSDTTAPDGFIGGGQIGYNWQYSPLIVVGLEADIQGALEKDSNNLSQTFDFGDPSRPGGAGQCGIPASSSSSCTNALSYTTQIDWFGTVRARLGYLWGSGQVLTYVTGGLAYGDVKMNGTNTVSGCAHIDERGLGGRGCGNFAVTQSFNGSHVNTGWVLGYGTEGRLAANWLPGNWTWKVESLYMDLGHLSTASVTSATTFAPGLVQGGQVTTNSHFTDWILRGGLNLQFH